MSDEPNVLYGGPSSPKIDEKLTNIGDLFLKQLKRHGDKVLFICGDSGNTRTAAELYNQSIRLAEWLRHLGVRRGDVISICSENQLNVPIVFLATIYVGAIVSPLSPSYTEAELNHVVNLTKPRIIFTTNANIKNVAKVASRNSFIQNVVAFESQATIKDAFDFNQILSNPTLKSEENFKITKVDENDTVLILVSSGTTGLPKGVEITHFNVKSYFQFAFGYIQNFKDKFGSLTLLNVLPWFHTYGLLSCMGGSLVGEAIITLPKFSEKKYLETIQKYKAQVLVSVPPILVFLAKDPLVKSYDLSSVRVVTSGAAPMRKETLESLRQMLHPSVVFTQGYGMSETTIGILSQKDDFYTPGSVGVLFPGSWGKVIDVETGKNLGPNQEGELCFKGDFIMKGYVNNPVATKATIDAKGWLHTGDIGYYDHRGEWFVVDRMKELIKFKGFQVPPAELEALLLTHPKVADAAVIGLPDEAAGELPMAFVVLKQGERVSEKEIVDFVAGKTSSAKRLRGGVRFVAGIPKNPTGKILRRVLRDSINNRNSKL